MLVVIMNHVLRHTVDPVHAITNVAALLKPGGMAIIDVPNNESVGLRLAGPC
jgi:2-polyprenyl-3-methyl-5-hydroxy-6-metoxy-1,4-benzoquinol methylase